jgi:Nucleoside-diphosphate-sugar epimerases
MRIGITGACGFLGANFIAELLDPELSALLAPGGLEILAFASSTPSNPLWSDAGLQVETLDVLDYPSMVRNFVGLDALVHFAGRVDYRSEGKRSVWDANALGTKRLFDACLASGVPRVLYVSSISALGRGTQDSGPVDENSSPYGDPDWPMAFASSEEALWAVEASLAGDYGFLKRVQVAYGDSKLAGWELAKLYAREKGLPVVTIFPGTAVGPGELHRSISRLVDAVWEGRLGLTLPGATSFVDSRDIARGAILALAKGRVGEGYVISGLEGHYQCYSDFMESIATLARSVGAKAWRKPLVPPLGLLLAAGTVAELLLPRSGLSRSLVVSGSLPGNSYSIEKARRELGYEPRTSLAPAIIACRRFSEALRLQRCAGMPQGAFFGRSDYALC